MGADGLLARRMFGLGLLVFVAHLPAASSGPGSVEAPPSPPPPAEASTPASVTQHCFYVVRAGESLGRIASRYGTTRRQLVTTNRLAGPDALRVGQRLEIPRC